MRQVQDVFSLLEAHIICVIRINDIRICSVEQGFSDLFGFGDVGADIIRRPKQTHQVNLERTSNLNELPGRADNIRRYGMVTYRDKTIPPVLIQAV